jgi:putative FmdB family regulatory protein
VPTYAYACTACGHAFDAVQKFTDAAMTECPECGGRLRKVYTSIGVAFKGSGFYRNDSRATAKGESGKGSDSSSEKSSEKSSDKGSEKSSEKGSEKSSGPSSGASGGSSEKSTSSTTSSSKSSAAAAR